MPGLTPFPENAETHALWLDSPEASARLGVRMARTLRDVNPGALLFFGSLGAGKTTLCRALVAALPGGGEAEISSPSFTICNIYCTEPTVRHFDLYRLPPGMGDEALTESLDASCDDLSGLPRTVTVVEWSEHLSLRDFPPDGVALRLSPGRGPEGRRCELTPLGSLGREFLALVLPQSA